MRSSWCLQVVAAVVLAATLTGCDVMGQDINGNIWPDAPNHSFINTPNIGPGPASTPTSPVSGHTSGNPSGR